MKPNAVLGHRYRLVRPLGAGGMGEVWEGVVLDDSLRVAIKLMKPGLVKNPMLLIRFVREAMAVQKIRRSKHVVQVLDLGGPLFDGTHYMVLEYVEGESLRSAITREETFEVDKACDLIIQACDGLAEAHGQGIVHRDIKPENFMLSKDEQGQTLVKLLDFGIAKFKQSPDGYSRTLTAKGAIAGTPFYMAPERLNGSGILDHRSDIYSLGIMLYELLTGRPPFVHEKLRDLVIMILTEPAAPPRTLRPELHKGVDSVIMKAIEKEPERRFQAVDDLAKALKHIQTARKSSSTSGANNTMGTVAP